LPLTCLFLPPYNLLSNVTNQFKTRLCPSRALDLRSFSAAKLNSSTVVCIYTARGKRTHTKINTCSPCLFSLVLLLLFLKAGQCFNITTSLSLRVSQHPHTYTTSMNRLPHEAIIHSYFRDATPKNTDDEWLFNAEIPAAQEMNRPVVSDDPCVPENQAEGNWSSKQEHLTAHYQFLREESTFALRRAIGIVREQPHLSELEHREISPGIGIYEKVITNQNQILQRIRLTEHRRSRQVSSSPTVD
jgi:hypothetical protein